MIAITFETESREKKKVLIQKNGQELVSRETSGNLLVCLWGLLKENKIRPSEIGSIRALPEIENSISARVGETHAQAIRYVLGLNKG